MVSTTLTTIVSSSGNSSSSTNQYQRPTHSTNNGRNFYFSTTTLGNDPKIAITQDNNTSGYQQLRHISSTSSSAASHFYAASNAASSTATINTNGVTEPDGGVETVLEEEEEEEEDQASINKSTDQIATTPNTLATTKRYYSLNNFKNNESILFSSSPPLSDQISILFPKCKPKNDVNLNPIQNNINNIVDDDEIPVNIYSIESPNKIITTQNKSKAQLEENISSDQQQQILNSNSPTILSSESSVTTPRISTNPFLTNQDTLQDTIGYYYNNCTTLAPKLSITTSNSDRYYSIDMPRKRNYHSSSSLTSNQNPFLNLSSNNETYWETRHNTTPASTVLNSPEITENDSRTHYLQNKQHIKVGRSPVSHPTIDSQHTADHQKLSVETDLDSAITTTGISGKGGVALVADGQVVVYDDVTESWQNLTVTDHNNKPLTAGGFNDEKLDDKVVYSSSNKIDNKKFLDRTFELLSEAKQGIMEYEGSPRRIGQNSQDDEDYDIDDNHMEIRRPNDEIENQQQQQQHHYQHNYKYKNIQKRNQSPSLYPARPGFPQRIISSPRDISPPPPPPPPLQQPSSVLKHQQSSSNNAEDTSNDVSEIGTLDDMTTSEQPKSTTFDYLYEFSETRKVLEEFFKCPSNDDKPIENGSDVDSIDIHYEFRENFDRETSTRNNYNNSMNQRMASPLDNNYHNQQQQQQQQSNNDIDDDVESIDLHQNNYLNGIEKENHDIDFFLDSNSRSSGDQCDNQDGINQNRIQSRSFRYSPETTDYDSNCGDLDSLSGEFNNGSVTNYSNYAKYYAASMPVLEDGLSSGHASDTENNNPPLQYQQQQQQQQQPPQQPLQQMALQQSQIQPPSGISMLMDVKRISIADTNTPEKLSSTINNSSGNTNFKRNTLSPNENYSNNDDTSPNKTNLILNNKDETLSSRDSSFRAKQRDLIGQSPNNSNNNNKSLNSNNSNNVSNSNKVFKNIDPDLDSLYSISVFQRQDMGQLTTPPPPAPAPHRQQTFQNQQSLDLTSSSLSSKEFRPILQRTKTIPSMSSNRNHHLPPPPPIPERLSISPSNTVINSTSNGTIKGVLPTSESPIWVPRHLEPVKNSINSLNLTPDPIDNQKNLSADEDDVDTDLETDRLLGHQRLDDQGFFDDNKWERKPRSLLATSLSKFSPKVQPSLNSNNLSKPANSGSLLRQGLNSLLPTTPEVPSPPPSTTSSQPQQQQSSSNVTNLTTNIIKNTTSKLLDIGSISSDEHSEKSPEKITSLLHDNQSNLDSPDGSNKSKSKDGDKKVKKSKNKEGGAVLIEGVLFRARYLGSTQLVCEGQPTKSTRMMQAEEAVSRIKAPDGDAQPSTEVDLFISTEKIMVLNTDLKEIMMDHALRTISYIADIGDLVVLMARRRFVPSDIDDGPKPNRTPKMICHVFESDEAQFIAQSIGQAFQVAYMEFLKANGIEDHSFVKEMDYQEVLNSQEIFGDELEIFAKKELQKEVVVPKAKGEILGVVIVESGWGSMLPTVVIANLMSTGAAARCGQLNIGDQLIAINGMSLVGLPLSTCQTYIKNSKNQTVVKFTVVPCPPVVEVKIKRPNTKYQLGFSVQNGVICSLLRGGIAERGGVRVGHRIIEINNQSVVAVPHEKIVNLLATSVGEILMKTMPTSMFRLLTGQENPIYI